LIPLSADHKNMPIARLQDDIRIQSVQFKVSMCSHMFDRTYTEDVICKLFSMDYDYSARWAFMDFIPYAILELEVFAKF